VTADGVSIDAHTSAAYVDDLTNQPGRHIGIYESIRLTRSLLPARLVDELRLALAPALAGAQPKGSLFRHHRRNT
jgi:dihydrofolate reductase